jgi:hypothetical protein
LIKTNKEAELANIIHIETSKWDVVIQSVIEKFNYSRFSNWPILIHYHGRVNGEDLNDICEESKYQDIAFFIHDLKMRNYFCWINFWTLEEEEI